MTLKCFDAETGELLWNRVESQPLVDDAGNLWTTRFEVAATGVSEMVFNRVQTIPRTLSAPTAAASRELYRNWLRKLDGATGLVVAEYDQGLESESVPFSAGTNPGEVINSAGQSMRNVSQDVVISIDQTAAGMVADYYVGPLMGQAVQSIVWEAGTIGEPLPSVNPVAVVPADSPDDVASKIVAAFGAAVTSVDVAAVTAAGATLENSQYRIRVEWADADYYLQTMQVQRGELPGGVFSPAGVAVWDGVAAQMVSFGVAGEETESSGGFGTRHIRIRMCGEPVAASGIPTAVSRVWIWLRCIRQKSAACLPITCGWSILM